MKRDETMATRAINKLTDTQLKKTEWAPGLHSDGGGLYFCVSPTLTKSWRFIYVRNGKRTEMGLGPYPACSLAHARAQAIVAREQLVRGLDPVKERKKAEPVLVSEILDEYVKAKIEPVRSPTVTARWRSMFKLHSGAMNSMRIEQLDTPHIVATLKPLWQSKPQTASYFRAMIERLIDYARVQGLRDNVPNPARWKGHLEHALAEQSIITKHHAAMPYADLPAFMTRLRARHTMPARCLEFMILTCVRQAEARGATWGEIDMKNALWSIPAARMKMRRPHVVPLTKAALTLLRAQHAATNGTGFVFPGDSKSGTLSHMALSQTLTALNVDQYTVHGFRSSFVAYMDEQQNFNSKIVEMCLAHRVTIGAETAYRRSDLLEKRGEIMKAWAAYLA